MYNQAPIETLNENKYIGIIFSRSGSFYKTKQEIANQATRAMYSLLRKIKRLALPIDTQIDLFEKTVKLRVTGANFGLSKLTKF